MRNWKNWSLSRIYYSIVPVLYNGFFPLMEWFPNWTSWWPSLRTLTSVPLRGWWKDRNMISCSGEPCMSLQRAPQYLDTHKVMITTHFGIAKLEVSQSCLCVSLLWEPFGGWCEVPCTPWRLLFHSVSGSQLLCSSKVILLLLPSRISTNYAAQTPWEFENCFPNGPPQLPSVYVS